MLTSGIHFINFKENKINLKIKKQLNLILNKKDDVIRSLTTNYKNNFNLKKINKYKKFNDFRLIGMGGSILGAHAIYDFLNFKIKKNFQFVENLKIEKKKK